ncbi:Centromere-associated protein E [Auxenochlorella protothecoides]|uniref:Centromere-associated protein E n=1 Tax=Auxenochlorella protothecoides TaxID=3075 RepID=A0A087S9K8_AUXPR|nr:Centromere-associated protein E [Auxenochlorella protothecoides]KFM22412.1 Centromere-associated protein E [Auxenochlorella protothecoides]
MPVTEHISVHVRVRPLSDAEVERGGGAWREVGNTLYQVDPATDIRVSDSPYTLDTVFDGRTTTREVYLATTQAIIHQVVQGFNGTVFAYGQTSSGKTHTMRGGGEHPGIVPLAVQEVFDLIAATQDREFLLRVSYMEIYNEDINDLLAPENQRLHVHESKEAGVHVAGLREDIVSSPEQASWVVLALLEEGERHRHVGETKMNKTSSRSHTIFRMVVESRSFADAAGGPSPDPDDFGAIRVSSLTLVDLAGSERMAKTGAEGQRAREGAAINKSLLTLGTVINKLSEGGGAGSHIPYRDSKLTRILQPALGGNARTAIICAVTPAALHVEESHSTLRFACRAKRVVNNATVNEVLSDAAVLKRQAREIEELRTILEGSGSAREVETQIHSLRAELLRKEQDNERMQLDLALEKEERERAQRKIDSMTRMMLDGARGGDAEKPKSKRENRRETWCPGAGQRKRPLLPALAGAVEEGEEEGGVEEELGEAGAERPALPPSRRSEGAALLLPGQASPPHKLSRGSGGSSGVERMETGEQQAADCPSEEVRLLREQVAELTTAQGFMQRELDRMVELAGEQAEALRPSISRGKGRASLLQMKEMEWRIRQLVGQLEEAQARLQETEQVWLEAAALEANAREESQQAWRAQQEALEARCTDLDASAQTLKQEVSMEALQLKAELQAATDRLEEVGRERAISDAKSARQKQELDELAATVAAHTEEKAAVKAAADTAKEKLAEAESRVRNLYEENTRLTAHISDLESRKRAPLYQKKQEEELRAALEGAKEAEIRAVAAELAAKEARVNEESATSTVSELRQTITRLEGAAQEAALEASARLEAAHAKAATETTRLEAALELMRSELTAQLETATAAAAVAEVNFEQQGAELEDARAEMCRLEEEIVGLKASLEEVQACADTATVHIHFLEEKGEADAAAAAEAAEAASRQLLETRRVSDALAAAEAATQQALMQAAEEAARLAQEHEAAVSAALAAHEEELGAALVERQELVAKRRELQDTLKDLRRRHKEDVARLSLALKTATQGSKGTEKASDRAQKEAEKLRSKVTELEAKLRAAVQDKNSAQNEKAAAERELKAMRSQAERLTKNMDKITGVEEKKRESIMVGFNQTKSRLQIAEEGLHRASVEVEKLQFELSIKAGEARALDEELQESKGEVARLTDERDGLTDQLAAASEDAEGLRNSLAASAASTQALSEEKDALATLLAQGEDRLADMEAALAQGRAEAASREENIASLAARIEEGQRELEAESAKVGDLKKELESVRVRLTEQEAAHAQAAEAAAEREAVARSTVECLETEARELADRLRGAEAELAERSEAARSLKAELDLATQELTRLQGALAAAKTANSELEGSLGTARAELAELGAAHVGLERAKAELEAALAAEREAGVAAEARIAQAHEETAECQATLLAAQENLAQAGAEAEARQRHLTAEVEDAKAVAEAARASWGEETAALSARIDELELQLTGAAEALAASRAAQEADEAQASQVQEVLRAESDALRQTLAAAQADLQAAHAAHESELAQLQCTLDQAQEAQQTALRDLQACRADLEKSQEECTDLDMRAMQAEGQSAALRQEVVGLKEQADAWREERSMLSTQLAELEDALRAAQEAANMARQRLGAAETRAEAAEEELRGAELRVAAARRDAQEAEVQCQRLRDEVDAVEEQLLASADDLQKQSEQAAAQLQALQTELAAARAVQQRQQVPPSPDPALADRCAALEAELRKSKRREEKLQALQYRLREDVKACGGDLARLEDLRERRSLEYELDRTQNRASREKAALRDQLRAALAKCAALEGGVKGGAPRPGVLQARENVRPC